MIQVARLHPTIFDPRWAVLRHVRRAVDAARREGAQSVLIVGPRSGSPRLRAMAAPLGVRPVEVDVADVLAGGLRRDPSWSSGFDLCLCDLSHDELASLRALCLAVLPQLKPDGVLVAHHLSAGDPLPEGLASFPHHENTFRDGDAVDLLYTGTQASVRLIRGLAAAPPAGLRRRLSHAVKRCAGLSIGPFLNWIDFELPPSARRPEHCTGVTVVIDRRYLFAHDNGSLRFAVDSGVYVPPIEALPDPGLAVPAELACPPGTKVILAFGQSNAANAGEGAYRAKGAVHVFNVFDGRFYRAVDPLPGATDFGGAIWGRLGDRLVESGLCRSVLIVPIAYGASFMTEWSPGGPQFRRLMFALRRVRAAGIEIDALCWQQGEAEANHTLMSAEDYRALFLSMLRAIRRAGVTAPLYAAVSTFCDRLDNPHRNHEQVRRALCELPALGRGVRAGPDTDAIGPEHRRDGCHFAASGLDLAAAAWYRALAAAPAPFERTAPMPAPFAASSAAPLESSGMLEIAKRMLLHRLERFGYVLVKKDVHQGLLARAASSPARAPESPPPAPVPEVQVRPTASSWPIAPPGLFPFAAEAEFAAFRRTLPDDIDLPEHRVVALFSAARHIVTRQVQGDVVDCTHAAENVLAVLAASLVFLNDTSRRLLLFDPTADPHHRAERVLQPWGSDFDLIGDRHRPARSPTGEPAPASILRTGYPGDRMIVRRYPREPIAAPAPVAFLGLTSETYPANRLTVACFVDRLVPGGVLVADRISRGDAVAEHLADRGPAIDMFEAAANYAMGVRR